MRPGNRLGGVLAGPAPTLAAGKEKGPDTPKDTLALPLPRYLRLVRHLKEADFVPLYIRYRVARVLRCVAARTISDFLAGLHCLLALPKGDADSVATLTVTEGDEAFEPVLLLQ